MGVFEELSCLGSPLSFNVHSRAIASVFPRPTAPTRAEGVAGES